MLKRLIISTFYTLLLCSRSYFMPMIGEGAPTPFHLFGLVQSYVSLLFFCPYNNTDSAEHIDMLKGQSGTKYVAYLYRRMKTYLASLTNCISDGCFKCNLMDRWNTRRLVELTVHTALFFVHGRMIS